jgi:thiosulfate/3-mercaptopyruvate sulfurtransferase
MRGLAEKNYKGYPDPSHVVSVEEASRLVEDKKVVFVDTRNYWKYAKGHVPGAVNLELYAFHWFDTSKEGLEIFAREMARLFGAYGIDEKKQVVFYQNDSGYDAARGVWLLEFLGNRRGRMLDGGLRAWKRRGLRLSKTDPDVARVRFESKPNLRVVCGLEELAGSIGRAGLRIVDARAPGEYDGTFKRALKAGHVPGAVNIEWKRAMRRDGTLKNARQLAALYGGLPIQEKVVTYCQSGFRAAHSWLVLRLLGYEKARNYLGSWYEWGNAAKTSVEK